MICNDVINIFSRIYGTREISENKKVAKISGFTVFCEGLLLGKSLYHHGGTFRN